jgi:hypothetical protein
MLGSLELIRIISWMFMGVLLLTYFNVDITSKLAIVSEFVQ